MTDRTTCNPAPDRQGATVVLESRRANIRSALKVFAAVLAVGGAQVALSSPSTAQLTQKRTSDGSERRICRYTQVTGKLSRGRRVCLTRAEWERVAEEQRKSTQAWLQVNDSCARRAEGEFC